MAHVYRRKKRTCKSYIFVFSLFFIIAVIITLIFCNMFSKKAEVYCAEYSVEQTDSAFICMPYISQNPYFPTGCESVSAVMLLNFYGYNVSTDEFIDNYLDKSDDFYMSDGMFYGPDPNVYFIGDPREENSYGCYEPVIEKAINKFIGIDNSVYNTSGKSLDYLCENYIDNNNPVLIWASIGMNETFPSMQWTLENGDVFTWVSGEHCLVLVGYDDENYYFNDPLAGASVGYNKITVEQRYEELGLQSLVINEDVINVNS